MKGCKNLFSWRISNLSKGMDWEGRGGRNLQLNPWKPHFRKPLFSAVRGLMAYLHILSGMDLWKVVSKSA